MHIRINKIHLQSTDYGNDFRINKVWLYDDKWKFMKFIKLNDVAKELLEKAEIDLTEDLVHKLSND